MVDRGISSRGGKAVVCRIYVSWAAVGAVGAVDVGGVVMAVVTVA